jgi:phage-related protein
LSGENGQTWQDFTITNQTTGESMQLMVSAQAGGLIRVDSDQKTVDVDGQNQIGALTLSSARRDWLRLVSGNNTLRLNTVNTPDLAIVVKWRKRML